MIGLLKLPLDGNPNRAIGLIAHPGEISDIAIPFTGEIVLTAGGADGIVSLWQIQPDALEQIIAAGGEGLQKCCQIQIHDTV